MAIARCKSGIRGWQMKLNKVYTSLEELKSYDEMYNIAKRLGFDDVEELWNKNPVIQGSTNPSDLRIVKM